MLKFRLAKGGDQYELVEPNLRAGCVRAHLLNTDGKAVGEELELVSPAQFQRIVNAYVDGMQKKGVRRFVYAVEEAGNVVYYSLLPSQVKAHAKTLYSLNTAGAGKNNVLSLSFRATKVEKMTLRQYGEVVDEEAAAEFHSITEQNNGFRGEVALYGRAQHKETFSDGKVTLPSGKKANSQLKSCARNSSRSLSKTHDIWKATDGIPEA